jgi:NAD-dependent dihydropyrimidine dehydrogenase PreA subunit
MIREIVKIDNYKCNGCGLCIPNCHEGALQVIDGKAVLISDLMCDGLGACLGHCPEGALTIEKREAIAYDEVQVMAEMVSKGKNVVIAHLKHLKDHNELRFLKQGFEYLSNNKAILSFNAQEIIDIVEGKQSTQNIKSATMQTPHNHGGGGCPGSKAMAFETPVSNNLTPSNQPSQLTHWPIQLHLIQPVASHFIKSDLLIAADCSAFSFGNFHSEYLKNRKLVIACPKLDSNKEIYVEKITRLIDEALVNTITVVIMEVPCCGGLLQMVQTAINAAKRKVPVKAITLGLRGDILQEIWV